MFTGRGLLWAWRHSRRQGGLRLLLILLLQGSLKWPSFHRVPTPPGLEAPPSAHIASMPRPRPLQILAGLRRRSERTEVPQPADHGTLASIVTDNGGDDEAMEGNTSLMHEFDADVSAAERRYDRIVVFSAAENNCDRYVCYRRAPLRQTCRIFRRGAPCRQNCCICCLRAQVTTELL
jgi:hypothetical protein